MIDRTLYRSRRTFIKFAAMFGGTCLFGLGKPAAARAKAPQPEPESQPASRGYRLTEHIKRYYETARR